MTPAVSAPDHHSGSFSASGSNDYLEGNEPEGLDEIIMAIDMKDNGTVGSAYYVAIDEALFLQEDVTMAGIEFVEMLLLRVEPTTVLISLRSPDSLVEFLEAGAQDFEGNREGNGNLFVSRARLTFLPGIFRGAYVLRTLGSSEFNYDRAEKQLMKLNFDALGPQTMHFNTVAEEENDLGAEDETRNYARGRLMRLATWIDLDSRFSVSLRHLHYASSWLICHRSVVLEQCLATSSAEGLQNTFPTIRTLGSNSEPALSKCLRCPTRCSSMQTLWHLCKLSDRRTIQIT